MTNAMSPFVARAFTRVFSFHVGARRSVAILLGLSLASCVHRLRSPIETLDEAKREALSGSTDARVLALAGFGALLLDSDAAQAKARFDAAVAADAADPLALFGRVVLAHRSALPEQTLAAALDLCQRAPAHPLAVVGARVALDVAGEALATDRVLRARVPDILASEVRGDAAALLRSALHATALQDAPEFLSAVLADMGTPTSATVVGPFSAWHRLSMAEATPPETSGSLLELPEGPFGPLVPRRLEFADGRLTLGGEPAAGDVYLVAVDFRVPSAGAYVVRTVTGSDHVVTVDGTQVVSRLTARAPAPTRSSQAVFLDEGEHRLLLRLSKESQVGHVSLAVHRLDGRPAGIVFRPAIGPPPTPWTGVKRLENVGLYASAQSLRAALEPEFGEALARWVAALDGRQRDPDGASRLLAELPPEANGSSVLVLKAELARSDSTIPSRIARGRAARDLEAALAKDPGHRRALLLSADLALEDSRPMDALAQLGRAQGVETSFSTPVLTLKARVEMTLGLDAQAHLTTQEAVATVAGSCEALAMAYDLARRRDAAGEAQALLEQGMHCDGAWYRASEHFRSRGELEKAVSWLTRLMHRDSSDSSTALALAALLGSWGRLAEAEALLTEQRALWPRNASIVKALADVVEQAGRGGDALALREAALRLDGADLKLRRRVERTKTGRELLDDYAISTQEALNSYDAAPGSEDATSAFVLDAAAIRIYPDGSMVDRVHIIQKALNQQGVQEVAEVFLPEGAEVLTLRTLKSDGRSLEPEDIAGKEGVSLPGVEVGDLVESEYLLAHSPRGPRQRGFTAPAFYFQIARQPNARSTYVVVADKGTHMEVDAHHLDVAAPTVEGELEVFRHEERRMPPFIPEPLSPPSANEWLPYVSVGAGQKGNEGLAMTYADNFLDRGQVTAEVEAFARRAAEGTTGIEAVKAVYGAVMEKLSGRDAGLAVSATASVVQDRGSRTWLLASALRALGFDSRLVVVRPFSADPEPSLFPNEGLLPYVCILVRMPSGEALWLDPLVRFAPFGRLPEFALGGRQAMVLPEPGRPLEKILTPAQTPREPKEVVLTMTLSEDGTLSGQGVETYQGYDAAQLGEALGSVSVEQRDQALESALSRYFGGAELSSLAVESQQRVGGTVVVKYSFAAQRFARSDGAGRLVAGALTFPHHLGRRFVGTSMRKTPLFIEASEATHTVATVALPKGWVLSGPVSEMEVPGPAGSFVRKETQVGNVLSVEERFRLDQARISPEKYDAFVQFAGEVDLLQQRDLLLEKVAEKLP